MKAEKLKNVLALHEQWLNSDHKEGQRANFCNVDLRNANLRGAIGDLRKIKTLQTDIWTITYTDEVIAIGCQQHSKKEWLSFNDAQITRMDIKALIFWEKWKPILEAIGVFDKSEVEI